MSTLVLEWLHLLSRFSGQSESVQPTSVWVGRELKRIVLSPSEYIYFERAEDFPFLL